MSYLQVIFTDSLSELYVKDKRVVLVPVEVWQILYESWQRKQILNQICPNCQERRELPQSPGLAPQRP